LAAKNKKSPPKDAEGPLRLIVAGPEGWRDGTVARLKPDKRFVIAEKIEADFNGVELARVTPGDVLVSTVDPGFPSPAIKLATALQKKMHGVAVVFVLPEMFRDELDIFEEYRHVWTLVSTETGEDPDTFAEVVWSASRGMVWIDLEMSRRLNDVRAVGARSSITVAGFEE
jgi:hypothetical protein